MQRWRPPCKRPLRTSGLRRRRRGCPTRLGRRRPSPSPLRVTASCRLPLLRSSCQRYGTFGPGDCASGSTRLPHPHPHLAYHEQWWHRRVAEESAYGERLMQLECEEEEGRREKEKEERHAGGGAGELPAVQPAQRDVAVPRTRPSHGLAPRRCSWTSPAPPRTTRTTRAALPATVVFLILCLFNFDMDFYRLLNGAFNV